MKSLEVLKKNLSAEGGYLFSLAGRSVKITCLCLSMLFLFSACSSDKGEVAFRHYSFVDSANVNGIQAYVNSNFRGNMREGLRSTETVLSMIRSLLKFSSEEIIKDLFEFNRVKEDEEKNVENNVVQKMQWKLEISWKLVFAYLGLCFLVFLLFTLITYFRNSRESVFLPVGNEEGLSLRDDKINFNGDRILGKMDAVSQLIASTLPKRYENIWKISQGGMGIIFGAHDQMLMRKVAIKMVSPSLCEDRSIVQRFLSEACSIASLDHPHILKIYDVGTSDSPYFVMEYLEGLSLETHVKRVSVLDNKKLKLYGKQIADAMSYCHSKQVIHRDIKPDNIVLVNNDEFIKLVDFGIAKDPHATMVTQVNCSMGSPAYMAPEQIKSQTFGVASDIYSFGVTLYRAASGKPRPRREYA